MGFKSVKKGKMSKGKVSKKVQMSKAKVSKGKMSKGDPTDNSIIWENGYLVSFLVLSRLFDTMESPLFLVSKQMPKNTWIGNAQQTVKPTSHRDSQG